MKHKVTLFIASLLSILLRISLGGRDRPRDLSARGLCGWKRASAASSLPPLRPAIPQQALY